MSGSPGYCRQTRKNLTHFIRAYHTFSPWSWPGFARMHIRRGGTPMRSPAMPIRRRAHIGQCLRTSVMAWPPPQAEISWKRMVFSEARWKYPGEAGPDLSSKTECLESRPTISAELGDREG